VVDEHRVDRGLQREQLVEAQDLLGVRPGDRHPPHDLHLLGHRRVPDLDLHQEPVALRLRQRVDALGLDRVLRRQHQERPRQRVRRPADAHLPLGHHLEQRRLHLRRRPVDLVDQHQVREHRPQLDVERLLRRPVDPRPHDVRRHEVRRELQPHRRAAHDRRQRLHRQRLGDPRHALQQAVTAREQRHQHPLDHPVLTDHDLLDLEQRPLERRAGLVDGTWQTSGGHEDLLGTGAGGRPSLPRRP
jgi:hypothetical protein